MGKSMFMRKKNQSQKALSLILIIALVLSFMMGLGVSAADAGQEAADFRVGTDFSSSTLVPNQMLTAKVTATNISTVSYSGKIDVLVIVGLYDANNTMINVSYISKGIAYQGTETLSAGFKLPSNTAGYSARAFMWDGTDIKTSNMIPISNAVQIPNSSTTTTPTPTQSITPTITPTPTSTSIVTTDMRDISAVDLVKDIRLGWNLGNTFDAPTETGWGNPTTTKAMIDKVKETGFNALRLPVTWDTHVGSAPNYTIDQTWFNRVEQVVNYALDDHMYVILNLHHENTWLIPTYANEAQSKAELTKVWAQIANRFKNYSDYLIFETMNEPRVVGSTAEWTGGTSENRQVINDFNLAAVNTIRGTGGNNEKRFIMVPTHAACDLDAALNDLVIPNNDNRVIVSIHAYSPYYFAMDINGTSSWGSSSDMSALSAELDKLYNKFIKNGRAVVIGEFGTIDKNNLSSRVAHAEYYAKEARARGIAPFWWDNGYYGPGKSDSYALLNRSALSWYYPDIANALVRGSGGSASNTPIPTSTVAISPTPTTVTPTPSSSNPGVLLIGRFDTSDPAGPKFAWSDTTIKANFQGTGISVKLTSMGDNWFNVIIDGVVQTPVNVPAGNSSPITLASGLANGKHTIELVRRTEAWVGDVQFLGFTVTGGSLLAPPAPSSKRIEFIGDSITCGYGNEGTSQYQNFTTKNENAYLAYGAVTARLLSADPITVCWSGKGVISNYGGDTASDLMPAIYPQILPNNKTLLWDTSKWIPQVVVINLGTNDFSTGSPDKTAFTTAYAKFVDRIRSQYPNAHIYCAIGPMLYGDGLANVRNCINTVITQKNSSGDQKVHYIEFPTQDGTNGYGEDWHPTVKTHELMANKLAAQIRADLGW